MPLSRALGSALLPAALAFASLFPASAPASRTLEQARGGARCQLTVQASAARITTGEAVNLWGALLCPESTNASERTVTVYRSGGGVARSQIGTSTTAADGSYQLSIPGLQSDAMLSVRAPRAAGAHVAIKVAPRVTLGGPPAGSALAAAGLPGQRGSSARATFAGSAGSAAAGDLVALQRAYSAAGEWRTVALGRVGDDGSYAIAHAFGTPGTVWVRVVVHPGPQNVAGVSEEIPYQIAAAQNPHLSIYSSSPLLAFGESTTVSGVAAGAAGQPLALFARDVHGSFEQIASTTAGADGRYSFVQVPRQRAYYRVRDARAHSTTLFQDLGYRLAADTAPGSVPVGESMAFTGTLAPAGAAALVQLERQYSSGLGFHPIASAVSAAGTYQLAHAFGAIGTYVLRVRVIAGSCCQSTASAPFTLQVTPAPGAAFSPALGGEAPAEAP